MRTHAQIISEAGGYKALASKLGLPEGRVRFWERRKRIPAKFWATVAEKRVAGLKELAGTVSAAAGCDHGASA